MTLFRVGLPILVFLQGLILAAAVSTRWKYPSNRNLAIFLFLLSLHGLVGLAWQTPTSRAFVLVSTGLSWIPYLYGPLVYRYVWSSLFKNLPDPVPFAVHAIPALLNIVFYGGILVVIGGEAFAAVGAQVFAGRAPAWVVIVEFGKFAHGILYSAFAIALVIRNRQGLRVWAARAERSRWLGFLVAAMAFQWITALVSGIIIWGGGFDAGITGTVSAIQLLGFLVFFYAISFFTLRYPAVLEPKERREAIRAKLNLPPGFVEETLRRLEKARRKRFYVDEAVTLTSLAEDLGLHQNALSFIVNEEFGCGFREYLNRLRLDDYLERLRETRDAEPKPTHLELAMASGFASKSTFLRAFRSRFETTPSEYNGDPGTNSHT